MNIVELLVCSGIMFIDFENNIFFMKFYLYKFVFSFFDIR